MNKLYVIQYFIDNQYYCESCTFYESEIKAELQKLPEAKLTESNKIHDIYRIDI